MTLDEFMTELRKRVDAFEADWRKEADERPYDYPMEFDREWLWWEQFEAWLETYDS